jgi:hypothetical protein
VAINEISRTKGWNKTWKKRYLKVLGYLILDLRCHSRLSFCLLSLQALIMPKYKKITYNLRPRNPDGAVPLRSAGVCIPTTCGTS